MISKNMSTFNYIKDISNLATTLELYNKTIVNFRNYCLDLTDALDIIDTFYLLANGCHVRSLITKNKLPASKSNIYNKHIIKFENNINVDDLFKFNANSNQLKYLAIDNTTDLSIYDSCYDHIMAMCPLIIKHVDVPHLDTCNIQYTNFCIINDKWEILRAKRVFRKSNLS